MKQLVHRETAEGIHFRLIQRLDVALVFNMKHESADEIFGNDGGLGKLKQGTGSETQTLAAKKTDADTYAEWDTEETILAVKEALAKHHTVTLVEADEDAYPRLRAMRPDIVFNIAEGLHGPSRESQIPAMLEMLDIPYSGSDPLTLGICLDKSRAKEILTHHGVPTPLFAVVNSLEALSSLQIGFPAIVKPLHEGSSKGIFNSSVVRTPEELRTQVAAVLNAYGEPALVEKFLVGREFTVAMLGNGENLRVLPIVEIRFDSLPQGVNPIYSYEAKWVWDTIENPIDVHECPASVDFDLDSKIVKVCKDAFRVLKCRDWCRIDIRLDEQGIPNVIELNPLPGILPNPDEHSCFPQAARVAGMDYNSMLNAVLDAAIERTGVRGKTG